VAAGVEDVLEVGVDAAVEVVLAADVVLVDVEVLELLELPHPASSPATARTVRTRESRAAIIVVPSES